jgi:predicted MFS family arabinose efflux permease
MIMEEMPAVEVPKGAAAPQFVPFNGYQKLVVAVISFLQFTIILDFMLLSPLGAILMPTLKISPQQFGLVVSVYAFSAGASGILAAGFADRFDRKKLLLFFYTGFVFGTFLCGIAPSYNFLLGARMVTGLFGGVIGSIAFAIITDLFPIHMRGRVMGFVQTSFGASQILGIPIGLYLANHWGWHSPFIALVALSVVAGLLIATRLRPINEHLKLRIDRHPFHHLAATVTNARYLRAFATTALLATGGFMMMPFGSAFSVNNLGIDLDHLPMVYMITGLCAIFTGPFVGRISDRFGTLKTFVGGSLLSIVMVIIYTHLGITPISVVILISAVMFVGISSRMIPSQALISAVPEPASRGSFMSVSASIQQISGGIAAILAGMIVKEDVDGKLLHFDTLGFVVCGATLITMFMMYRISRELGVK